MALALNACFRETESIRQTRSEILGDLQPVTMGDLLRAAEYEQILPWVHPRMGFPVRAHLYVDQVLGRDAASEEPVMILTARVSTAPLKYAPDSSHQESHPFLPRPDLDIANKPRRCFLTQDYFSRIRDIPSQTS